MTHFSVWAIRGKIFLPQKKPPTISLTLPPQSWCYNLKTSIGLKCGRVSQTCQFIVIEVESHLQHYTGRSFIHNIKVITSSYHQCMWYPENGSIYRHDKRTKIRLTPILQKDNEDSLPRQPPDGCHGRVPLWERPCLASEINFPIVARSNHLYLTSTPSAFFWEGKSPTQANHHIAYYKLNTDPSFPTQWQKCISTVHYFVVYLDRKPKRSSMTHTRACVVGGKSLTFKITQLGYYWHTLKNNAKMFVW